MQTEPPVFRTRIRITGHPLHLWNQTDIRHLVSGFGYPLLIAPHFSNGVFVFLRVLIKGAHPSKIPLEINVSEDPRAAKVKIFIEGYERVGNYQPGPYIGPGMPWSPPHSPPSSQGSDSPPSGGPRRHIPSHSSTHHPPANPYRNDRYRYRYHRSSQHTSNFAQKLKAVSPVSPPTGREIIPSSFDTFTPTLSPNIYFSAPPHYFPCSIPPLHALAYHANVPLVLAAASSSAPTNIYSAVSFSQADGSSVALSNFLHTRPHNDSFGPTDTTDHPPLLVDPPPHNSGSPPGFHGHPQFQQNNYADPPSFSGDKTSHHPASSVMVPNSQLRRSARLRSKSTAQYTSAVQKAQMVWFQSSNLPATKKQQVKHAQILEDFFSSNDPPTLEHSEIIVNAAGISFSPQLKSMLEDAEEV